jgi:predicted amidohydrolase
LAFLSKKEYSIALLQLKTDPSYRKNLATLVQYIEKNRDKDLIVAPEVYLTAYDYENFQEAYSFYDIAIETLLPLISKQIFIFTIIRKVEQGVVNQAIVIHNHQIVYTQNKYRLFKIGDEHKYFLAGKLEDINPFTINGVRYAIIICFELRFKELWRRIEGVDIVVIPAMWGKPRQDHLEALSKALAIMNQCFVVVANSANEDMAKSSSVIEPWGEVTKNNRLKLITKIINLKDVTKVRRLVSMR